jgi:hypothetical protein
MPLTVVPTEAAQDVNTEYAANIKKLSPLLIKNYKSVMPLARLMKENAREEALGPNEKFHFNMLTGDIGDSHGMGKSQVFIYEDFDFATQQEWAVHKWYASAAINDFDEDHYKNSQRSTIVIAEEKLLSIRERLTWRFNYDLVSPWNDLNSGLTIALGTVLAAKGFRNPPTTTLEYLSNTDRPYSIPMLIRKHVTGHTIGNIHSSNRIWQPMVEDATGYTPTRATTGINIDCVTNDAAATGALQQFSVAVLEDFLSRFQSGGGYKLYCLLPTTHYNYLKSYLINERWQTPEALRLRAELGFSAAIGFEEYNCTFFSDPMFDAYYPYSLWFFDVNCMFPVFDANFAPKVVPWEKISSSNMSGTVAYYNANMVSPDRVGLGAMHGWYIP